MAHLCNVEKLGEFLDALPRSVTKIGDPETAEDWLRRAYWDLTQQRGAMVRARTILGNRPINKALPVTQIDLAIQNLTDVLS